MAEINTVQDLINALQLVENKELPVFIYSEDFDVDLQEVSLIDYDISDRVDINVRAVRNNRVEQKHGIANTVKGRHINQMIFLEREEIGAETFEFLDRNGYIEQVDYGNEEIGSDYFKEMIDKFDEQDKIKSDGTEITLEEIRGGLGLEVYDGLLTGKLDFIQIIY